MAQLALTSPRNDHEYLDDKERRDGLRPRTLHGIRWTLGLSVAVLHTSDEGGEFFRIVGNPHFPPPGPAQVVTPVFSAKANS